MRFNVDDRAFGSTPLAEGESTKETADEMSSGKEDGEE